MPRSIGRRGNNREMSWISERASELAELCLADREHDALSWAIALRRAAHRLNPRNILPLYPKEDPEPVEHAVLLEGTYREGD